MITYLWFRILTGEGCSQPGADSQPEAADRCSSDWWWWRGWRGARGWWWGGRHSRRWGVGAVPLLIAVLGIYKLSRFYSFACMDWTLFSLFPSPLEFSFGGLNICHSTLYLIRIRINGKKLSFTVFYSSELRIHNKINPQNEQNWKEVLLSG